MSKLRTAQAGHALTIVLIVAVLLTTGLIGWRVARRHHAKTTTATAASTSNDQGSAGSNTATSADNASLQHDVQSIDSAMSKENGDSAAANNSLNDQQQQIAVPTN